MKTTCPNCGTQYTVSDALDGKPVRCKNPDCQQTFTVSIASGEPADTPAPIAPPPLPPGGVPPVGGAPSPASPPPIAPPGAASPEGVYAEYQETAKPATTDFGETLKRGARNVKDRAVAMKLAHEVKKLHGAVDGQLRMLGELTLRHQPPAVDISAEVAGLSQIQADLAQKQLTLESLAKTSGAASTVKELKAAIAELHARQQALVVAIGQKTDAIRPEIPDAAGIYSGLDHLRASLAAEESQLKTLEEHLGPILPGQVPPLRRLKLPLVIGGAVLAGVVVVFLVGSMVFSRLFAGSLPGWAAVYVPDDVQTISYDNIEQMRQSDLSDSLETAFGAGETSVLDIEFDDVAETLSLVLGNGDAAIIIRTRDDLSMDDVLASSGEKPETLEYRGVEYVQVWSPETEAWARRPTNGVFVAKADDSTFCLAGTKKALEEVLGCWKRGEKAELDKYLQQALQYVATEDGYTAGIARDNWFPTARASGYGYSAGSSSVDIIGILVMRRERDADRFVEDVEEDGFFETMKAAVEEAMPASRMRDSIVNFLDSLEDNVKISQKAEVVYLKCSLPIEDIQDFIESTTPPGG